MIITHYNACYVIISVIKCCKILGKCDQAVCSSWLYLWIAVNKHDFNVNPIDYQMRLYVAIICMIFRYVHIIMYMLKIGQTTFRYLATGFIMKHNIMPYSYRYSDYLQPCIIACICMIVTLVSSVL